MTRTKKDSSKIAPPDCALQSEFDPLHSSCITDLIIPSECRSQSDPLAKYLHRYSQRGPTLLSRFDDSLMDVAPNTRKAYNTDVWTALVVKFFRDWDFPKRYDELASELVRLEALRRLGLESSQGHSHPLSTDDPLRAALDILNTALPERSLSGTTALTTDEAPVADEQPRRMSLRGSFVDAGRNAHLEQVCINSSDKQTIHYLFSRYESHFDSSFWNHFFALDSLGRVFREQEASGNSPATLARKMASLQRFEKFLHCSSLLTRPTLFMQRRPRVTPSAQIVLKGDELHQIERYFDQIASSEKRLASEREPALLLRDRAMFSILDQYLVRATALCNLTLNDIDLRRKTMRVAEKGRKERVFPLEGGALQRLNDYLTVREQFLERHPPLAGHESSVFHTVKGQTMNSRSLSRIIDQRAEEAGIKAHVGSRSSIGAHVIRRSGGARYIEAGARIEAVSQVMNHSQIATTWRYVGNAAIDLSEEVFRKRK